MKEQQLILQVRNDSTASMNIILSPPLTALFHPLCQRCFRHSHQSTVLLNCRPDRITAFNTAATSIATASVGVQVVLEDVHHKRQKVLVAVAQNHN